MLSSTVLDVMRTCAWKKGGNHDRPDWTMRSEAGTAPGTGSLRPVGPKSIFLAAMGRGDRIRANSGRIAAGKSRQKSPPANLILGRKPAGARRLLFANTRSHYVGGCTDATS